MPSKIRKDKSNKTYDKFFPVCYREFGVTTNKYKILQEIVKLSYAVYISQKIINNSINRYPNQNPIIIQKITTKITYLKEKITRMKNQTRGHSFDSIHYDTFS
ncbi:hypothetical protein QKC54_gp1016 [Megavirus baoshan]|uniref:Uncharacterized protein n=1 Tax=Megavirus baoshan TaxID=2496520 RepID=A0A3S5HLD8_9VIRU|nr:hypothetical protein QKC54_gp1016 [Megavirus baoshan]AZL89675.1 hypothetical protein Mb0056 [Megavirus baoshan]